VGGKGLENAMKSNGGGGRTRTYEGLASGFTVRPLCRSGHSPYTPQGMGAGAYAKRACRCQPKTPAETSAAATFRAGSLKRDKTKRRDHERFDLKRSWPSVARAGLP
jgi:hypothetical protein